MSQVVRSIASLLVGVALLMLGNGALGTLIGLRLSAADAGPVAVGLVTAAFYAGLTAGSLYAYRIVLRVGHIRAFSAFASVFSAASLSHALVLDLMFWSLLRLMEGFTLAGLYMCIESWLNDRSTNETRGQVLSLYMVTLFGAMALGQQLLNIDSQGGALIFMVISILLSLALVPVALTRSPAPTLPEVSSFSFSRLYEVSPLGVVGVFISGAITGAIYGLAPVFGAGSGFGVSGTAVFMTVLILGGVILQWPLGRLSDRFDRRTVIIGLSAALSLTSMAMLLAASQRSQLLLLVVAMIFGGLSFTLYPVCLAHTNDHVDRADLVAASGGLILANSVGAILGPILASMTMQATGVAGLFAYTTAGALGATLFGLWRSRMRPPVPAEDQGTFHPVPQTTPVVVPLDPRQEELEPTFDFEPAETR